MRKKSKTVSVVSKKEKFINGLFISAGILFVLLSLWFFYIDYLQEDITKSRMIKEFANKELPSAQICMYGNEIQGKPAIAFSIGNETFYACCKRCQRKLMNNFQQSQFAIDPFSHNRIKKSQAIVVLNQKSYGKVDYFESINNFIKLKEQQDE